MTTRTQHVIVGVDGSEEARRAAAWAAEQVQRHGGALELLMIIESAADVADAQQQLREAAELCSGAAADIPITEGTAAGHPADALVHHSARATGLVLGARGRGSALALLGSVSTAVAMRAECPVTVVREGGSATGPVVVGADESPGSASALEHAFSTAAESGSTLVAVQVWHETGLLSGTLSASERDRIHEHVVRSLDEQMSRFSTSYPDVAIRSMVHHGNPVARLCDASRDAQLIVVGHRGGGGFEGLFLGSVAAGVLHHAHCPVLVVRPSTSGR